MATIDGQLTFGLDIPKTARQINEDIKKLQNRLAQIKVTGALDTGDTVKQINAQIAKLQAQLKKIDLPIDNSPINRLNTDIRTLANALKSLDLKGTGLGNFKTEIDGVEVELDSLIHKLSAVGNAVDLGALRSQVTALQAAFRELAQTNVSSITDQFGSASMIDNIVNSIINAEQLG